MRPPPVGPAEALACIAGKTFVLAGRSAGDRMTAEAATLLGQLGGVVLDGITPKLNYLVVFDRRPDRPTAEERQVETTGCRGTQILNWSELRTFLSPTPDEARMLLRAGEPGLEQWRLRRGGECRTPIDLSGIDLRNAVLTNIVLYGVTLDGADLRGADLSQSCLDKLVRVNFDSTRLVGTRVSHFTDCSACQADLTRAHLNPAESVRTDFTGAKLTRADGSCTRSEQVCFRGADLTGAMMQDSAFAAADFAGANLSESLFDQCDLTGADFRGATLVNTSLSRAKLVNANLSGADLSGANLAGADLTGAAVDGANFTGATLYAAHVSAIGPGQPVGFAPPAPVPIERIGPNMRHLEGLWRKAGQLEMHLLIDPDSRETDYTQLRIDYGGRGAVRGIVSCDSRPRLCQADTPCEVMLEFASVHPDAVLCPEGMSVVVGSVRKTPKGLSEVAVAAWHEAFGRPLPTPAQRKAGQQAVRERLLAMLRGGSDGVARWNAVRSETLLRAGHFRGVDLSGCDLRGARLCGHLGCRIGGLDFDRAKFAGANLGSAGLSEESIVRADFRGSVLDGARLPSATLREADFERATMKKCDLRFARCRDANFRHADLTKADFTEADVSGADFTGANLDGVRFRDAKHDATTKFPAGFTIPTKPPKSAGLPPVVGSSVRVTHGAFASFEGEATNIDTAENKVTVQVVVFGRPVSVELPFDDVEPV